MQWLRRGGGGTTGDFGESIAIDGSGNVYVAGTFNGTANFNTPSLSGSNELVSVKGVGPIEDWDIFIAKYNSFGSLQWLRRGGPSAPINGKISTTATGRVIAVGNARAGADFGASILSVGGFVWFLDQ